MKKTIISFILLTLSSFAFASIPDQQCPSVNQVQQALNNAQSAYYKNHDFSYQGYIVRLPNISTDKHVFTHGEFYLLNFLGKLHEKSNREKENLAVFIVVNASSNVRFNDTFDKYCSYRLDLVGLPKEVYVPPDPDVLYKLTK